MLDIITPKVIEIEKEYVCNIAIIEHNITMVAAIAHYLLRQKGQNLAWPLASTYRSSMQSSWIHCPHSTQSCPSLLHVWCKTKCIFSLITSWVSSAWCGCWQWLIKPHKSYICLHSSSSAFYSFLCISFVASILNFLHSFSSTSYASCIFPLQHIQALITSHYPSLSSLVRTG